MNDIIKSQALIIAERLHDLDGFWFHYKKIKVLGFQRCYELSSLALQMAREGRIKRTSARFYNGCIRIEEKKLKNKSL